MHMIAYTSDLSKDIKNIDETISEIVKSAKTANEKQLITGVLFYLNGRFLQVIEGEEQHLRDLLVKIEKDNRHGDIEYLIDTKVESRGFKEWNMDSFNLDNRQEFSKEKLKSITEAFKLNLMPRSDMLVYFYKALLKAKP